MLDLAAKTFEDRPRARRVGRLGAHQPEQLALARRRRRAADWAFHKYGSLAPDLRRQRRLDGRRYGAHLDEQLTLHVTGEKPRRSAIDRVDRSTVGQDGDDGFARGGDGAWARHKIGAGIGER